MSRTYLYAVRPNGDVTQYAEVRYSAQGALHIWNTIITEHHIPATLLDNMQPLWDAPGTLGDRDDWVLLATFDHAIVQRDMIPRYLAYLRAFTEKYPTDNLREQILLIQQMYEDPDILGIAWVQTSASGDDEGCSWWVAQNDDEWNPDSRPYNINVDSDHFFVTGIAV